MADTIQALDRALELLIYLNKQGREVGITQIASDMGGLQEYGVPHLYPLWKPEDL